MPDVVETAIMSDNVLLREGISQLLRARPERVERLGHS